MVVKKWIRGDRFIFWSIFWSFLFFEEKFFWNFSRKNRISYTYILISFGWFNWKLCSCRLEIDSTGFGLGPQDLGFGLGIRIVSRCWRLPYRNSPQSDFPGRWATAILDRPSFPYILKTLLYHIHRIEAPRIQYYFSCNFKWYNHVRRISTVVCSHIWATDAGYRFEDIWWK